MIARSTVTPYIEGSGRLGSRIAKVNGKRIHVPEEMNYQEFEEKYLTAGNPKSAANTAFIVSGSLSAMAKRFYVESAKPLKQHEWYIKEGSTVSGVKVIAEGEKIREVQRLIENYPLPNGQMTKAEDWKKCRGTATITNGTIEEIKEIHWYQCENIGKVEFKRKDWSKDET